MFLQILKLFFSTIFGNIKLLIYKLFFLNAFKYPLKNKISFFSTFSICENGQINIGENCKISPFCTISVRNNGQIKIGKNFFLNNNGYIVSHEKISIGNNVIIGPNVVLVDHDHQFSKNEISKTNFNKKEIIIGNNVWIGANCVILKGTKIGDNSIIGAGSVIHGEYNSNSLIIQKRVTSVKKIC